MERTSSDQGPLPEPTLSADEAALRDQCQRIAREQYPGSRVLVEQDARGLLAGVVLPEDGADLDVSAVRAGPCSTVKEVLRELEHNLRSALPRPPSH